MVRWWPISLGVVLLFQGCGGDTADSPASSGAGAAGALCSLGAAAQGGQCSLVAGNNQGGAGTSSSQGGAGQSQGGAGSPQAGGAAGTGGAAGEAGGASAGAGGDAGKGGTGMGGAGAVPTSCEDAAAIGSSDGCEFWALDLDNEPDTGLSPNASAAPWALAITNPGTTTASVTIEVNDAPPGQPLQLSKVKEFTLAPGAIWGEQMPTREVDGSATPGDDKAPGTWLSSNAFRITSSAPVAATQFNTATNSFSNDASMLLPRHALGARYVALGWPAANPAVFQMTKGLPDRSYLTIVGVEEGTTVQIKPTWRVKAGGPVALTAPGGLIEATLGPFDVLNLETDTATTGEVAQGGSKLADLSGSTITASKPVAVFVGSERGLVPEGLSGLGDLPKPPSGGDNCCTDHLEEQLVPLSALGSRFVIPHSPFRSTDGFREADVIRFQAAAEETTLSTNLPPPNDSFTLQPGETRDTWSIGDVFVASTKPLLVAQLLVSQAYCSTLLGDPALLLVTPVEQHQKVHSIQAPPGWDQVHVTLSVPTEATVTIDGQPMTGCDTFLGALPDGAGYATHRCPVSPGAHRIESASPIGVYVYAYGMASAVAFAGGAGLAKIYEPPAP